MICVWNCLAIRDFLLKGPFDTTFSGGMNWNVAYSVLALDFS